LAAFFFETSSQPISEVDGDPSSEFLFLCSPLLGFCCFVSICGEGEACDFRFFLRFELFPGDTCVAIEAASRYVSVFGSRGGPFCQAPLPISGESFCSALILLSGKPEYDGLAYPVSEDGTHGEGLRWQY
jgi:hypothetical protein